MEKLTKKLEQMSTHSMFESNTMSKTTHTNNSRVASHKRNLWLVVGTDIRISSASRRLVQYVCNGNVLVCRVVNSQSRWGVKLRKSLYSKHLLRDDHQPHLNTLYIRESCRKNTTQHIINTRARH